MDRPLQRVGSAVSLLIVLTATLVTLGLGLLSKSHCATVDWRDGRQYRTLCYTDIVPLLASEHLNGGRLPYVDRCPPGPGLCDEYPVLTMYLMRLAGWIANGFRPFFYANAALLAVAALATAWSLHRVVDDRALYFALAPTLAIDAFINWDLLAVALAAGATLAFFRKRDLTSGVLLGLGAAAKLYPALFVVPFAASRFAAGDRRNAARLAGGAAGAFAAVNLPFALAAPTSWSTFFRANADRPADFDSLWFVVCQRLHGGTFCSWSPHLIDAVSLGLLVTGVAAVWWSRRQLRRDFPLWSLGFPIVAMFLLVNKVYSPQYSLWLIPWFALTLPSLPLFVLFELADAAVFVTRFAWFGRMLGERGDLSFAGFAGVPLGAFQLALAVRAAVLIVCVVAWIRRREEPRAPDQRQPGSASVSFDA